MEMKWQVISVDLCWDDIRCLPCLALWTNKTPVSRAVNQELLRVGNVFQKTWAVETPSGFFLCQYVLLSKTDFQYHPAKQLLPCNSLLDKSALNRWHDVYPWLFFFQDESVFFTLMRLQLFLSPSNQGDKFSQGDSQSEWRGRNDTLKWVLITWQILAFHE